MYRFKCKQCGEVMEFVFLPVTDECPLCKQAGLRLTGDKVTHDRVIGSDNYEKGE